MVVWCGVALYDMVWHGMVWHGMVPNGMVWHGKVWHGMVRYGMHICPRCGGSIGGRLHSYLPMSGLGYVKGKVGRYRRA